MLPGDKKIMIDFIKEKVNTLKMDLEELKNMDTSKTTEYDKMRREAKIASTQTEIDYYLSRLEDLDLTHGEEPTAPKM